MPIDITNKEEKQIALTGTQIEETLLQAHLSKDAIEKIEGLTSNATVIDSNIASRNSFNAINSVTYTNDGVTIFDSYAKKITIPIGSSSASAKTMSVNFNNALGEINNALAKGIIDFKINISCEATKNYNIIYTVQSNLQNVTLGVSNIPSGDTKVIALSLTSGEILTNISVTMRYADSTAAEELYIKLKSSYLYSSNGNSNLRLQRATINEPIDDNLFQQTILINRNQYQVSHTTTNNTIAGLTQTYRGFKIAVGTVLVANKAYIGRYLTSNFSYLNGRSFTTKIIVKVEGDLTASQVFTGTWVSLGDSLYSTTLTITNFDAGNSSHIFGYNWNRAITPTSDITVTFMDLYISGFGNSLFTLISNHQSKTEKDPIKIYCSYLNMGTYGQNYMNLVTALHSLTDGSETNIYDVYLDGGTFDLTTMLDYTNIQDQTSYKRGLELSPYVNLYGVYNTIINCKFTVVFATSNQTIVAAISPLNFLGNNKLKNLKVYAENCRYAVHDDGNTVTDCIVETENCHFEHLGNDASVAWQSTQAYGSGFPSGKVATFKNTNIVSAKHDAISVHTSHAVTKAFKALFYGCSLISKKDSGSSLAMLCTSSYTPKIVNTFELHGCNLSGSIRAENTTATEPFNLVGGGNTIVPIVTTNGIRQTNLLGGQGSQKVTSTSLTFMNPLVFNSNGKVRAMLSSDATSSFIGFAQKTAVAGALVPIQESGYIIASDLGLTLVQGDTVAIDAGIVVKNGINTIGKCVLDGYLKF